MQNGNRAFINDTGAGNRTNYEPWRFRTRHVAAASAPWYSPTATATKARFAWQDSKGVATAGGIAAEEWNNSVFGGKFPASKAAVFTHLMVDIVIGGGAAVMTEAQLNAFCQTHCLYIRHQGIDYDLGRLKLWASPVGTSSHRITTATGPRPLPAPFTLNPNEEISIEVRCVEEVAGTLFTAADKVDVCGEFFSTTYLKDAAVIKQ